VEAHLKRMKVTDLVIVGLVIPDVRVVVDGIQTVLNSKEISMAEEKKPERREKEEKPTPKDNLVVTKHTMRIGGKEIKYTVTAGTMVLKEETGDREKEAEGEKPRAQIFFVAYTKDGVRDPVQTSAYVFVQRRTRFLVRVAASGSAGTAAWC
jgi:carboxypeptidase C (cathepsin A)